MTVPPYKMYQEKARLDCPFNLGKDRLYAVKWYKDNEEFFRFVPRYKPAIHVHKVDGINVVVSTTFFIFPLKLVPQIFALFTALWTLWVVVQNPEYKSFYCLPSPFDWTRFLAYQFIYKVNNRFCHRVIFASAGVILRFRL